MKRYGIEIIFQIYTSHPAVWLNNFENVDMLHVYSVVLFSAHASIFRPPSRDSRNKISLFCHIL